MVISPANYRSVIKMESDWWARLWVLYYFYMRLRFSIRENKLISMISTLPQRDNTHVYIRKHSPWRVQLQLWIAHLAGETVRQVVLQSHSCFTQGSKWTIPTDYFFEVGWPVSGRLLHMGPTIELQWSNQMASLNGNGKFTVVDREWVEIHRPSINGN